MSEIRYEPEFAWAVAWSNGKPRPFIMVHYVAARRKQAIESFIANWQYDKSESVMKAWRRAYREGARCIRVSVNQWGDPRSRAAMPTDTLASEQERGNGNG